MSKNEKIGVLLGWIEELEEEVEQLRKELEAQWTR
jgi:hypothetical protein